MVSMMIIRLCQTTKNIKIDATIEPPKYAIQFANEKEVSYILLPSPNYGNLNLKSFKKTLFIFLEWKDENSNQFEFEMSLECDYCSNAAWKMYGEDQLPYTSIHFSYKMGTADYHEGKEENKIELNNEFSILDTGFLQWKSEGSISEHKSEADDSSHGKPSSSEYNFDMTDDYEHEESSEKGYSLLQPHRRRYIPHYPLHWGNVQIMYDNSNDGKK